MSEPAVIVDYTPRLKAVCPRCGSPKARTIYCEPWFKGDRVWFRKRRHVCRECGNKFNSLQESV